ncbi:nucleotidyltransferase [Lampropedia cohaerens]|uniref:Nucleotidyltransferase n=1 Tax=Lampropedia cohaerens TaxID=1610491 RepID=A0A0U1PWF8_9BURK|nr:nucleotidyltransferase family protein [Lampropedia cohaerens]KKW66873.1 nucleotidyltransferase [Lampropedia cohaerens]
MSTISRKAQAMILAAGRGQRMRPLTDHTPKPLLPVRGQPLITWHLAAMARAGLQRVVINTGWLGAQIPAALGSTYSCADCSAALAIHYSREDLDFGNGIETAGGIARALPLLEEAFWLVAGDVHAPTFVFDEKLRARFKASATLAHIWLVPNPPHHPSGDFCLADGLARPKPTSVRDPAALTTYTYSTLALLKSELFTQPWCDLPAGNPQGQSAPLGPLLLRAAAAGRVAASLFTDPWTDVGTPQRLAALQ